MAPSNATSPTRCGSEVALRLLAHGAEQRDFTAEMRLEYAIAAHMAASHDFIERVRALLIEKDNAPVWNPAPPAVVSDAMIDAIVAPLLQAEECHPFEGLGAHCYLFPGRHKGPAGGAGGLAMGAPS